MSDSRAFSIDLQAMARQVMLAEGFEPNFPPATQQQLADISAHPPQLAPSDKVRDLRGLLWSSIDNDTSRDLDQIEVAERLPNGDVKVMVGIADVDAFVAKDSPSISMRPGRRPPSTPAFAISLCCRKISRRERRLCLKTWTGRPW